MLVYIYLLYSDFICTSTGNGSVLITGIGEVFVNSTGFNNYACGDN